MADEQLQARQQVCARRDLAQVAPYARLVSDDAGISLIGLGLAPVTISRPVDGDARQVDDALAPLPQQRPAAGTRSLPADRAPR